MTSELVDASSPACKRLRGASAERSRFRFVVASVTMSSHCIVTPSLDSVAEGGTDALWEGITGIEYTLTLWSVKHGLGSVVVVQGVSDVFSAIESLGRIRISWSQNTRVCITCMCMSACWQVGGSIRGGPISCKLLIVASANDMISPSVSGLRTYTDNVCRQRTRKPTHLFNP